MVFSTARAFLARRLGVNEKDITLIGSGRIGFSLASAPDYGRPFSERSDLDFCAVSEKIFGGCNLAFTRWQDETKQGLVNARNSAEGRFWKDNLARVPGNLARGFVDPHLIPYRYKEPRDIAAALWLLETRLGRTVNAPRTRGISIRVYRDWSSFLRQNQVNLNHALASV
jgi:hypothetical protein